MASWLRKLLGDSGPLAAVHDTLEAARADGQTIEVVSATGEAGDTVIELLLDDGFVVARPTQGALGRSLGRFETLTLRLHGPRGAVTGRTRVLGRFRLRGSDGHELLGYKLEYPAELTVKSPRRDLERVFGADAVQEATLRVMSSKALIHGLVDEISPAHVVLLCRNAGDHLKVDGEAVLHLDLPRGGVVDDVVRIAEVDQRDGSCTVRVLFRARQAVIARSIRAA